LTPDDEPDAPVPEKPHADDGLDLAKALTRATAGATPKQRKRQRNRDRQSRGRVSGSHPDDRDPQLLGGEVSRLIEDRGWELDLRMRGVFARWPELVGEQVADHCTPETFTDGKLVVRAGSTAWATQLRLLAPTLVRRLNEELGHGTVTVIDVLGPHGPSWKKGPRSARDGRGPRDTYG
jgi:predicted nucleic acid-binding Zn ribbon protein